MIVDGGVAPKMQRAAGWKHKAAVDAANPAICAKAWVK